MNLVGNSNLLLCEGILVINGLVSMYFMGSLFTLTSAVIFVYIYPWCLVIYVVGLLYYVWILCGYIYLEFCVHFISCVHGRILGYRLAAPFEPGFSQSLSVAL